MESFIENFTYDKLNRLETASVTGYATQTFAYDAIGNIKSKTGTGTGDYLYPASGAPSFDSDGASNNRPHAVKEIPGIGTFGYDANGNMEVGNGRTITWTSFDMPGKISSSATGQGIASSFTYGADHQRTKQIKTDPTVNSTVYYAGAMEVEIKGGTTTIKTYWPGGLGVEIDRPNEAAEWNWTHADRLGSVIAVTNAGGDLVERLAYDAWGKRRNLRGNSTDNNIDGQVDNKGFTGHEMLDKLDLVHMNGRIYDPLVARFMSADPLIQDPEHSQSYNRYTYVWNNPTNLTDPTGFASVIPCDQDSSCVQGSDGNSYGCRDGGGKITNCFEGGDANNEQPSGEQSTNNSPDHTGTPEKKASVTDDLAKGFQDSKTDYGVMEPLVKRTVSEKIGRVVGKVTDFGVDLAKAATGVADADIARAEWNEKKYVRSTIHWMAAVGNAGLTVLTFGEWAAIRAAMFEVVPSGVNVVRSGEFSIVNWNGYPSGVPKPAGPFRLLEGAEYANARDAANSANKTLRKDMELIGKKVDIHEVQPVKFNGNPTDRANKVILDRDLHRKEVTPWWNALQRALEATKP